MRRKAISIWLTTILVAAVFTVIFAGSVSAISNDHNLSGIVWQSDGSIPTNPPNEETDFCIWVYHDDSLGARWYRFPSAGWVKSEQGDDGLWWYSYVLPYGLRGSNPGSQWTDQDIYKVEVDGTPWAEFFGNTTSNGTGSLGDPFPTPYDPSNPANFENTINHSVGGGFANEQQWDVRTVAPIDLSPTNVTSDGRRPSQYPGGFPATPGGSVNIYFNVTNVGTVPSGPFEVKLWNSTSAGAKNDAFDQIFFTDISANSDSGLRQSTWPVPTAPGTYWVLISVDDNAAVTEFDEGNNEYLINFTVGPELIIEVVLAKGDTIPVSGPVYVGRNSPYDVTVRVRNIGQSPTGLPGSTFKVTLYEVDSNLILIPGTQQSQTVNVLNATTSSGFINWNLIAPNSLGDFWLNITVDYDNDSWESNEFNNDFTIWFNVPDVPVTTIKHDGPRVTLLGYSHWWITSSTTLDFESNSSNPPDYIFYEIFDQAIGNPLIFPFPANYTDTGLDNFTLTWGERTYRVGYYSIDSVGAVGLFNNKTIIVDDTPPTSSLSVSVPRFRDTVANRWKITSGTPITISAIDNPPGLSIIGVNNASGVDELYYRILQYNDSTVKRAWAQIPIAYVMNDISTSNPFSFDSTWLDGLYVIEYRSVDKLGNTEIVNSEIIYLDNTPPDQTIDFALPNYREDDVNDLLNISSVTDIIFTADDGLGSGTNRTEYRIWDAFHDTGWVTYSGAFTVPTSWDDGIYTIDYNSTDNLGNDYTESQNIYLDNTGPDSDITGSPWSLKFPNNYQVSMATIFTMSADDHDGSGVFGIQYRLNSDTTWYDYSTPMNFVDLFPSLPSGQIPWNHTIYVRSIDNLDNEGPETEQKIYIEGDIAPPLPPVLRAYIRGNDIRLEWEPSESTDVEYYMIYRGISKTEFDFTSVHVNTQTDSDGGVVPLRTTWNDVGAAATTSADEYYYTIRSVDNRGNLGYTSNIVGKSTLTFKEGYNTFSLPLKPFDDVSINGSQLIRRSAFTDDRDTIYRYNVNSQQWIGHARNMPSSLDDFTLNFGEGYMVYVVEETVKVSFTGSTGTTIRFTEGVGGEEIFRKSLTAKASENQVELSWGPATDATGYAIYRGTARLGDGSLNDFNITTIHTITGPITTWTDTSAAGEEFYYLVVAMDGTQEGASTYSIGVKKVNLAQGYSLVSVELAPKIQPGAGRFSADMFSEDEGTLFYYDREIGEWRGHPRILPENINNGEINTGLAYIVYTDVEDVRIAYTGM